MLVALTLFLLLVHTPFSAAATPRNQAALSVDPMEKGPYAIERQVYEGGDLLLNLGEAGKEPGEQTLVPLRGSVTYPINEPNPSRVVVFLHGNYTACLEDGGPPIVSPEAEPGAPSEESCPQALMARSFEGYNYLSDNLSSHGYIVISPQANFASIFRSNGAPGNVAREELLQATLELAEKWNEGTGPAIGPIDPTKDPAEAPSLKGRLDLSAGIGLMGHSRGGDGVTHYIEYDRNDVAGPQYPLSGVLAIAPVDSAPSTVPEGTNYGVLLPGCDGDVSDLQGAKFYGPAKYDPMNDDYAKMLWYVNGADHDFYNNVWGTHQDDALDFRPSTPACQTAPETGSARLSLADEQKTGIAIVDSFMRRYVGGETALNPLMTGETTLPSSACPSGPSVELVPCDTVVRTSYVAPSDQRLDVLRPAAGIAPPTADEAGGPVTPTGLSTFEICEAKGCPEGTKGAFGEANFGINPLAAPQLVVGWKGASQLELGTAPAGGSADVSGDEALTFETTIDQGAEENPVGAAQDFTVTLTDAAGHEASTRAGNWTGSLTPTVGAVPVPTGAWIPLSAFEGVDLSQVTSIKFQFAGTGMPKTGKIQLAGISFLAPPPATTETVTTVPPPTGPQPPLPTLEAPTPAVATVAGECTDDVRPDTKIGHVAASGHRARQALIISGHESDRGCAGVSGPAAGGVSRTLVSISIPAGKDHCRFLRADGRWSAVTSCKTPVALSATRHGENWDVKVAHSRGLSGTATVRAWSYDLSGNRSPYATRKVHFKD
ncbi:MAG TPA: hypothetical protein VGC32_15325 [Solirubrobacterales bacterium]